MAKATVIRLEKGIDMNSSVFIAFMATMLISVVLCRAELPFAEPKDVSEGSARGIQTMAAGDLNDDGLADVVAICGGKHANGRIFAWFEAPSNMQGSWTRHDINPDHPLRSFLGSCALADFDSDGDLDLAVSSDNHSGGSMEADVYVFENPGHSTAGDPWPFKRVTNTTKEWHHINDMAVDDMDGDGKPDIICRSLKPNEVHIFFQNRMDSWTLKSISTGLSRSEGLAVGKLDSDALPDIEYTGFWLKSPANPRSQEYTKLRIDDAYHSINQNTKEAIGDIDGDGLQDVIISPAEWYRGGDPNDMAWYKNPGTVEDVNWQRMTVERNTNNVHQVKLADFDDDGNLDIIAGWCFKSHKIKIYVNDGSGSFGDPQTISSSKGLYSSVMLDMDGDGDIDIAGSDDYADATKPWVYENLLYDGATAAVRPHGAAAAWPTSALPGHPHPALGYRFDLQGRRLVPGMVCRRSLGVSRILYGEEGAVLLRGH